MKTISHDVLNVLAEIRCDGHRADMTHLGTLDRTLYVEVNKVLDSLGGKWNRFAKAHIFDREAAPLIEQAVLTGAYHRIKQEFGQFDSPPQVVTRVIELAGDLHRKWVLEPSAGLGNIAVAAQKAGALVWCYEIDSTRFLTLTARLSDDDGRQPPNIERVDFLSVHAGDEPGYDLVLMNPPFGGQADIDHVLHAAAFLKAGGRLVSVMSESVTYRSNRKAEEFRRWVASHKGTFEQLDHGAFAASGTMVRACILTLSI